MRHLRSLANMPKYLQTSISEPDGDNLEVGSYRAIVTYYTDLIHPPQNPLLLYFLRQKDSTNR